MLIHAFRVVTIEFRSLDILQRSANCVSWHIRLLETIKKSVLEKTA